MNTDSFIVNIKAYAIYKNIAEDFQTRSEVNRPLPKGKNKKLSRFVKDELGGKIMKEFLRLRVKIYS